MDRFKLKHSEDQFVLKPSPIDGLRDFDGNPYTTVVINDQEWIVENYKVTRYGDGSPIPLITDATEWPARTAGARCYYNNDTDNIEDYGMLYNLYAVLHDDFAFLQRDGVAESGWRVPSYYDFEDLISYLGGDSIAGGKMKEQGLSHWSAPNYGASNTSGFTLLAGGHRSSYVGQNYIQMGLSADIWTTTELFSYFAETYSTVIYPNFQGRAAGLSVRLMRDVT